MEQLAFRKGPKGERLTNSRKISNVKHQEPVVVHVKLTDFLTRLAPQAEFDMAVQWAPPFLNTTNPLF